MDDRVLLFEANLNQLAAFAEFNDSRLTHTINSGGRTFLHCCPKSSCPLSNGSRTQQDTLLAIQQFLVNNTDLFNNCLEHQRVLHCIRREFPGPLARTAQRIEDLLDLSPASHPIGAAFDKQQNVKLLLTTPGGPVTRWAHAEALTHESAYFRRALADAEAGADGVVAIDLPAMSEASLDFLLQLLHNRSARLPRNVSDLCDILNDQRKLEALSGKRELDQAALRQIYRVAEAGDVATLVKKVDDWTSDLGLISIAIAARNFDTIAQSGALTVLPPEALARVLSSPDLQLHEHKVVLHTLGWIQHYCAQHPEISAEDLAHQALYKGQSLVQLLRFEHLTLEEFAKAMAENRVLHDSEFQRWYSWLASGAAAVGMPHRSPRIPFLVKTSNRGQRLHVFWRIPVDKHLGHARQSRYEIIALAQSPSFELCGDEWRLQFNLSPYGPYLLTLQRLFTKDSPRFMRAQVDALFPMDGHSRSFSCIYSPLSRMRDVAGMGWEWLDRVDPSTGDLPVELVIDVEPR